MRDILTRLYKTKLLLSAVLLVVAGLSLLAISNYIDRHFDSGSWLVLAPVSEFGGILIGAGLLSIWLDHFLKGERDAIEDLRLRQLLHEQAPAMRDAVLAAFAANNPDLKRVATPEMLDQIITNSLALRLDDPQFAAEIYTDVRDQAVLATERWHDAVLSIDLSPFAVEMGPGPALSHSPNRVDYFAITVRWEYTVVPRHAVRRFICTSDRAEYQDIAGAQGDTTGWFLKASTGVNASSPEAFELVQFTVNGKDRPIRRSSRTHSQTYTAAVGADVVAAGEPVNIAFTYRTLTRRQNPLLFFEVQQPTRDLSVDLDYSGTGIAELAALDFIPSLRPTRIERTPTELPHSSVRMQVDGWIFPRSGIAFVWTLVDSAPVKRSPGRSAA